MCQFFSCISDGKGDVKYFDAQQRKLMKDENLRAADGSRYDSSLQDSHSGIAGFYGMDCDKVNKYEYNPLTRRFVIDQTNTTDDQGKINRLCRKLDFATIVPELIIKPIFHPFEQKKRKRVNQTDIGLLKKWASVQASVGASVWDTVWDSVRASVQDSVRASVRASVQASVCDSVRDSVGGSVRASVYDSVGDSVGDSVWDSVCDSVGDSVGASVWASVCDSVWASVWDSVQAYVSSFFDLPKWKRIKHKKGENPFQSCIDLWHRGIVPSFDGKAWRLHGYEGKVLKVIPKDEL